MSAVLAAPPPTKEERRAAFRTASLVSRQAMHDAIAAYKTDILEARRELGRQYLAAHPVGIEIPFERGVTHGALDTAAVVEEAIALAKDRVATVDNVALQFPVLAEHIAADSEAFKLGLSPQVIAPLTRYFGMLPVLFNAFVTRAHQTELIVNSAHLFHLDPEDVISFKVFVHLTDVDDDCGPFHALPANFTDKVFETIEYQGVGRITDEQVDELVGFDNVVKFTGPRGAVAWADTTRCLHFGGRPRKPGKPVRDMIVYQYLVPTSSLFPIDGDARRPNFLTTLEPNGDPTWDALIGATLT